MTTHVLQFVGLSKQGRKKVGSLPKAARGDAVEVRVSRAKGGCETALLPPEAAALIGVVLDHLRQGQRVAVLAEEQEISPNDAAIILGISRPLVVHRMDVGDLPFRYVGRHRRAKLKDVLLLKRRLDAQQTAIEALAENTDALMRSHGL
jgi:hypothetical protein